MSTEPKPATTDKRLIKRLIATIVASVLIFLVQDPLVSISASEGNFALMKAAVFLGGNMNSSEGGALFDAVSFKDYDTARYLLDRGANVNQRPIIDDRELDYTPLVQAVRGGDSAIVALLIKYNADVNVVDDNGDTPLTIAASNGDTAICYILLSHGASPNHKNQAGLTALAPAKQAGHRETMLLIAHITVSK